jgi:hypothetical protein
MNSPERVEGIWRMYLDQNAAIEAALDTLCPEISYQPSSPFRGYGKGKSSYEGDYHSWSVLGGSKPVDYFETCRARFFSEYGYESFDYYEPNTQLKPFFNEINPVDTIVIERCGKPAKYVFVYELKGLKRIPKTWFDEKKTP